MTDTPTSLPGDNERYTVPALERGLRLLACFSPSQPVWSAPDLARTLDLPRSTVFRMLTTLEGMGYLQRAGVEYRLGLAVLRLGYDYLSTQPLTQLAEPVLQSLCDRLGLTANLALLDGTSVVYVGRIAPAGAFQGAVRVGSRLPAHATVLGRALLQDLDANQLQSLFGGHDLPQFSERTPRNVAQLQELLALDRQKGYVVGEGFYEPGVSSIAAPVRDAQGRIVAGLGVALGFTDIAPERMAHWVEQVQVAAAELSGHVRSQHPGFLR
jgi:DNA-binding IclR family transcriptional regulator